MTFGDSAARDRCIPVNLSDRSYEIEIGSDVLRQLGERLASVLKLGHVAILFDGNVAAYAEQVEQGLRDHATRVSSLPVAPGEASKAVSTASDLWNRLLEEHTDRASVVVAVGGGVVGDLAGFVAATYARGLHFCQVPTTLLAQVDSSVGGKVGINLPNAKNIVGAFWQPCYVLADVRTLDSLPNREYLSGMAEIVKYGMILDADFFEFLDANADALFAREPRALLHAIATSCRIKARVVTEDERELTGLRAVLNYGHTFAHAIESVGGYGTLLHGEAVSIGMVAAARLAGILGRVDPELEERQRQLLRKLNLPVSIPAVRTNDLIKAMRHDKKNYGGRLGFILPNRIGNVETVRDVAEPEVSEAIEQTR